MRDVMRVFSWMWLSASKKWNEGYHHAENCEGYHKGYHEGSMQRKRW
jgi:hypothetical protein